MAKECGFAGIAWMHAGMRGWTRRLSYSGWSLAGIDLFLGSEAVGYLQPKAEG